MSNVKGYERLTQLPALFRGGDATILFGWTSKAASHYLWLWSKQNLVKALGGHSDVYANMVMDRNPDWAAATLKAMPSATIIGIESLRRAGWTTQIPARPEIAVTAAAPSYAIHPYEVSVLPPAWFERMNPLCDRTHALPALPPVWALADLIVRHGWGRFGLDPDDIETDSGVDADQDTAVAAAVAELKSQEDRKTSKVRRRSPS